MPSAFAALAFAGLALTAVPQAHAADGIFGDLFTRFSRTEAPTPAAAPEARDRDREARNLRREYWERERARLSSQASLSRDVSNRTVAAR